MIKIHELFFSFSCFITISLIIANAKFNIWATQMKEHVREPDHNTTIASNKFNDDHVLHSAF